MADGIKLSDLSKRKRQIDEDDSGIDFSTTDSENSSSNDNQEIVQIDFDFFNGNPDIDFHALKNLIRQLFGPYESNKLQLSSLVDLILNSPTTTIKTDGQESDPYSFISFINYKENKTCDYVKYLNNFNINISSFLKTIDQSDKTCGLVIGERLINMPPEVIPPLYKITLDDVKNSLGSGTHYDFYLIASRKYEINFDIDDDDDDYSKSHKKMKQVEIDYFHEEDKFFEKYAKIKCDSESKKGLILSFLVIDHDHLVKSIDELEAAIATW